MHRLHESLSGTISRARRLEDHSAAGRRVVCDVKQREQQDDSGLRLGQSRRSCEPLLVRMDEQLLAVGHAQLVKNISEMMADRNTGDTKAVGNVFIGQAFTDQAHNFAFSFRQAVWPLRLSGRWGRRGGDSRGVA